MFKVIKKYTRNNEIVAWRVSDGDVEYNIPYMAPYHELFFDLFIKEGYVYNDYNCNILSCDGYPIKDMEESDLYLSDEDIIELNDMIEVGMIDEKDIVSKFKRNINISYVELEQPIELKIKTREELNSHIKVISDMIKKNINLFPVYPVNAFCDKEVLYSLEEVISNKDGAGVNVTTLFNNNILKSLGDLKRFSKAFDVDLSNPPLNMGNILMNYFKWGIPGIKANITSIRLDLDPLTSFKDLSSDLSIDNKLKYGLRNKQDNTFYCEDCDPIDYYDINDNSSVNVFSYICGRSVNSIPVESVSEDYECVAYGEVQNSTRIVIDLLSNDGLSATFVANCNEARIYSGSTELKTRMNMFKFKTLDNTLINFDSIAKNGISYISDSILIRSFIDTKIKECTVKSEYDTSYDLMTGIGVSPYYAPMLTAERIRVGVPTSVEISSLSEFGGLHYNCAEVIRNGFSSNIVSKYGPEDEDFLDKSISEQLEYINEEIGNLQSEGNYLVQPEIPEGMLPLASKEYVEWHKEYTENEIGKANFVVSLFNGDQSINNIAIGSILDKNNNDMRVFNIIYSGLMACRKDMDDSSLSCKEYLDMYIEKYVNISNIFKERNNTAMGCIKDMLIYRSEMATSSDNLIFVTKVFRENGNSTIEECKRHFGFESLVFFKGPGSKGKILFNNLREQVLNDLSKKGMTDNLHIMGDTVALAIFGLKIGYVKANKTDKGYEFNIKTVIDGNKNYSVDLVLNSEYYNLILSNSYMSLKYASNYDFCENQFNSADMTCLNYCVNASINPWFTKPRKGFYINEYNLFVNYYNTEDLRRILPEQVFSKLELSGGKVFNCLKDTYSSNELFPTMSILSDVKEESKLAKEGLFLERLEHEDLDNYMVRTLNDIKMEKASGNAVKNTVLKSDLQYKEFKPYGFYDGVVDDNTLYEDFSNPISNRHITSFNVRKLSHDFDTVVNNNILMLSSNLESESVKIEKLRFNNIPYDIKSRCLDLLLNNFNSLYLAYFTKGNIKYGNKEFKLSNITLDELSLMVEDGVAIQIDYSTFVLKTINGLLKVGV